MITNEMEINKVYWCSECGEVTLEANKKQCPSCGKDMQEIGFVEDNGNSKQLGGSVKQGNCKCGNPRAKKGIDHLGRIRYRTQCYQCLYQARIIAKADSCRICGISPEDKKDLHKDHVDGDRSNNSAKNIQTLCVDCHQYKTTKQKDWKKKDAI